MLVCSLLLSNMLVSLFLLCIISRSRNSDGVLLCVALIHVFICPDCSGDRWKANKWRNWIWEIYQWIINNIFRLQILQLDHQPSTWWGLSSSQTSPLPALLSLSGCQELWSYQRLKPRASCRWISETVLNHGAQAVVFPLDQLPDQWTEGNESLVNTSVPHIFY